MKEGETSGTYGMPGRRKIDTKVW